MNRILPIHILSDYQYDREPKQALEAKQSLSFMCSYKLSYKRRNRWLECPGGDHVY